MQPTNSQNQYRIRINQYIRATQVRLIKDDNTSEVLDTRDALKMAQEQALDLVEINGKALPPIVRIMNFGKFKYEEKKKLQAAKKNQQIQELKEITLRPSTSENDINHKLVQAKKFLKEGNRVKFTIRFKGREITHQNLGRDRLAFIIKQLEGLIVPNPPISLEGKLMIMVTAPAKKN